MSVRFGMSVLTVTYLLWNIGPIPNGVGAMRRSLTNSTAFGDMSIPIHFRPSRSAATQAVAQPQKGSRIVSPSLVDALMMRSRSARGFCVG